MIPRSGNDRATAARIGRGAEGRGQAVAGKGRKRAAGGTGQGATWGRAREEEGAG